MTSELKSFVQNYKPFPTALKFHLSGKLVKGLMGTPGSAKTSSCLMEIVKQAKEMPPNPRRNNKRCSRWAIIRDTYPNLKETTLYSVLQMFPEHLFGRLHKSYPIKYEMRFDDVELELLFLALSSEDDYSKLRSLELTGIYANELCTLPELVIEEGKLRIGRMPSLDDVPEYRSSIIFDTNPPYLDSWQARKFEDKSDPHFEVFKQPPALIQNEKGEWVLNPLAENVRHTKDGSGGLTPDYYLNMRYTKSVNKFRMLALNQYGLSEEGLPCLPQYNDIIHYADWVIEFNPSYELGIFLDFGTFPAALLCQYIDGQILCLKDFVGDRTNLREFLRNEVMPFVCQNASTCRILLSGDPAGKQNPGTDGFTHVQIAESEVGEFFTHVETNSIEARLDAVALNLTKLITGKPALVVTKNCPLLRKALNGDYKFEKKKILNADGTATYQDKPLKNMSSHIADALQYACLYYNGYITTKVVDSYTPEYIRDAL